MKLKSSKTWSSCIFKEVVYSKNSNVWSLVKIKVSGGWSFSFFAEETQLIIKSGNIQ